MHSPGMLGSAERPSCAAGTVAVSSVDRRRRWPRPPRRWRRVSEGGAHSAAQPIGLYILCIAEGCAGFAFYTLGALLVLYLTEGAGLSEGTALRWVGLYNGLCYVVPLVGGLLADRWLGLRVASQLGALLFAAGLALLSATRDGHAPAFALALLVAGMALFRSNIAAMVGRICPGRGGSGERAYRLFYVAFNIGAVLAPPIAGALARGGHFRGSFALASFAMLLALFTLLLGHRSLANADAPQPECGLSDETATGRRRSPRWIPIALVLQVSLLWTIAFAQTDGTLLLWARDHTDRFLLGRQLPASIFASVPALLVLILSPLLVLADRYTGTATSVGKLLVGLGLTAGGFALLAIAAYVNVHPSSMLWLIGCLVLLTLGELLVAPSTQAMISRFAPPHRAASTLSLWYAAVAIGSWSAGQLGALWERAPKATVFILAALSTLFALLLVIVQRDTLRDG